MLSVPMPFCVMVVAPHTGMWIEIKCDKIEDYQADKLLPTRGCGLKSPAGSRAAHKNRRCSPHGDVD